MNQDEGRAIARVLSTVLGRLVTANDRHAQRTGESPQITKFHALRAPSITIADYVERIFRYASCSSECFVLALIYIDRIIKRQGFVLNSLNVHRIVITSVMLSAKFFDDHYFKNGFYAKIGGVPCNEMNILEVEFLFLINFSLHVAPETYLQYYLELCSHARTLPDLRAMPPTLRISGTYGVLVPVPPGEVPALPQSQMSVSHRQQQQQQQSEVQAPAPAVAPSQPSLPTPGAIVEGRGQISSQGTHVQMEQDDVHMTTSDVHRVEVAAN